MNYDLEVRDAKSEQQIEETTKMRCSRNGLGNVRSV